MRGTSRWVAATVVLGVALIVTGCYLGSLHIAPQPVAETTSPATPSPTASTATPRIASPAVPRATPDRSPVASASPAPQVIPSSPVGRSVYLVPIGPFPADVLTEVAGHVSTKYDIDVQILVASPLDGSDWDSVRDQYVAEDLLDTLVRSYSRPATDEGSVIIGVLTEDVYIRDRPDWNWAFGLRGGTGYAVVSTARMGSLEEPIVPIITGRLRKMVLRDIGVLYYGLPLNYDPISLLYADVLGVDDLDRMGEELCGSDCPSRASTGRRMAAVVATFARVALSD